MKGFRKFKKTLLPWLFMTPAFLILLVVLAIPIVWTCGLSFYDWSLLYTTEKTFVGFKKYAEILTSPIFWKSLKITMILTVACTFFEFIIGLALALLLNREIRARNIFRGLFLIPMMITPIVVGLQWRWLYDTEYGLINYFVGMIGFSRPNWLINKSWVLPSIIIAETWENCGYVILFLLAGLQSIPQSLYEAAQLDGASRLKRLLNITLPLLKPVILIVLIMRSVVSFRIFALIYTLTGGGPANATKNLAMLTYETGFSYWRIGQAAALAVFMMGVCMFMGIFYIKFIKIER